MLLLSNANAIYEILEILENFEIVEILGNFGNFRNILKFSNFRNQGQLRKLRIRSDLVSSDFQRNSDFFIVIVIVIVEELLHERGFSKLKASRAKK